MKTRLAHYAEGELNLYPDVLMKLTHIFFYAIGAVIPSIEKLLFVDFVTFSSLEQFEKNSSVIYAEPMPCGD
jgi:hypothetical protein